jgi:hypothetical protein
MVTSAIPMAVNPGWRMRSAVPLGVPSFETAFVAGSEFS